MKDQHALVKNSGNKKNMCSALRRKQAFCWERHERRQDKAKLIQKSGTYEKYLSIFWMIFNAVLPSAVALSKKNPPRDLLSVQRRV